MSFKVNPLTDDLIAIKNQSAIARSIRNLVLTAPGERFFNNDVGSRVNELLFENMDELTASSIQSEIENKIKKMFYAVKDSLCRLDTLKDNVSFQLFGLDVIFTNVLEPYILEMNKGPEMKPKNKRDYNLKHKLNQDLLQLVGIINNNQKNGFKKIG